MKSACATLLEELQTHAAEAAPHEQLRHEAHEAAETRNQLTRDVAASTSWDEAKPLREKLSEAEERAEHLRIRKPTAERELQKAWGKAIDAFTAASADIRKELEAAAGEPALFGTAEVLPSTFEAIAEKLIQRQVACAKVNRFHFMQSADEGREIIALIEEIIVSLPRIEAESKALAAAASTYNQALAA